MLTLIFQKTPPASRSNLHRTGEIRDVKSLKAGVFTTERVAIGVVIRSVK